MSEDARDRALAAAKAIDIDLPEQCLPGVVQNRRLLDQHLARLGRFLADHPEA